MTENVPEVGEIPVPASIKAAVQPQVNLIPPEVEQRRQKGRNRLLIMLAFAVWIGVLVAVVVMTEVSAQSAESALEDEQQETTRLNTEIASYAHVPRIQAELENADAARLFVGGIDVDVVEMLLQIQHHLPDSVAFESLVWDSVDVEGNLPDQDGLFDSPDIGGFSFSGRFYEYYDVTYIEDALNSIPGFERARLDGLVRVEEDGSVFYTFTGSVRYNATLLTNRFGPEWEERRALENAITEIEEEISALAELGEDLAAVLAATSDEDTAALSDIQTSLDAAEAELEQALLDLEAAKEALASYIEVKAAEEAAAEENEGGAPEPSPSPSTTADTEGGAA